MDKIEPPEDLSRALAAGMVQTGLASNVSMEHTAEAVLYSPAMQTWLRNQFADRPTASLAAAEPREPVTVECKVRVPFSSALAAVGVLSRIPFDASITLNQGTGDGIARWTEER